MTIRDCSKKILTEALSGEKDYRGSGAQRGLLFRIFGPRQDSGVTSRRAHVDSKCRDGRPHDLKKLEALPPLPANRDPQLAQCPASAVQALELGAGRFSPKPGGPYSCGRVAQELAQKGVPPARRANPAAGNAYCQKRRRTAHHRSSCRRTAARNVFGDWSLHGASRRHRDHHSRGFRRTAPDW